MLLLPLLESPAQTTGPQEPLDLRQLLADPLRDFVYAIHDGEQSDMVLEIEPETGGITRATEVGDTPQDMAFSPDGERLYVISLDASTITEIDLATFGTRERAIDLDRNEAIFNIEYLHLAVGEDGIIYHSDGSRRSLLRMFDFEAGQTLKTFGVDDVGDLQYDPLAKALLVRMRKGQGIDRTSFRLLDTTSPNLAPLGPVMTTATPIPDVHPWLPSFIHPSDRRLFAGNQLFALDTFENLRAKFPGVVEAVSADGTVVALGDGLYDSTFDTLLAEYPYDYINDGHIPSGLAALSRDQRHMVFYLRSGRSLHPWPLPLDLDLEPAGFNPQPADGSVVSGNLETLRWQGAPFASGYRIYFGTSANAVSTATPGAPEDLGVRTSFDVDIPVPLGPESTYYWRIDILRGSEEVQGDLLEFTVAPFAVERDRIEMEVPVNRLPFTHSLGISGDGGGTVEIAFGDDAPWLSGPSGGTVGSDLPLTIDASGLAVGGYQGEVEIIQGGFTVVVTVAIEVFGYELSKLEPDPLRQRAYGLHRGDESLNEGRVIFIDASTGRPDGWAPAGRFPWDLDIQPGLDELYVLDRDNKVQVIDLETLDQREFTIPVADTQTMVEVDGRGRVVTRRSSHSGRIQAWSTEDGSLAASTATSHRSGNGAISPDGTILYYADFQEGSIHKHDLLDPSLARIASSDFVDGDGIACVMSADGQRLFWNRFSYDTGLNALVRMPGEVWSASGTGSLAVGETAVWSAATGTELMALPFSTRISAFSRNDRYLLLYDPASRTVVPQDVSPILTRIEASPQDGQEFRESPTSLSWWSVDGATAYQIYLSSSQDEVVNGTLGTEFATTTNTRLDLGEPLPIGTTYWWRVDAVTAGGVVPGEVLRFDVGYPEIELPGLTGEGNFRGVALDGARALVMGFRGSGIVPKTYLYDRRSDTATLEQELPYPQGPFLQEYGRSPSIDGEFLIVPAPFAGQLGSVVTFDHDPVSGWVEGTRLLGDAELPDREFGRATAMEGGMILIGEPGAEDGRSSERPGVVHFMTHLGSLRTVQQIVPAESVAIDRFGAAIDMDGDVAIIGSPGEGSYLEPTKRSGRAVIFELDPATARWREAATLIPDIVGDPADSVTAEAVAIDGGLAALTRRDGSERRVHLFRRTANAGWAEIGAIHGGNVEGSTESFATSVAVEDDVVFIGDPEANWRGEEGGAVFVFRLDGALIEPAPTLVPTSYTRSGFGAYLAIHDGYLVVGSSDGRASAPQGSHLFRVRSEPNQRPVFDTPPLTAATEGQRVEHLVRASDPDGDSAPAIEPVHLPTWLSAMPAPDGGILLSGNPPAPTEDAIQVILKVVDARGGMTLQASSFPVIEAPQPPRIVNDVTELDLVEGMPLFLQPEVFGEGPFTIRWQLDGADIPGAVDLRFDLAEVGTEDAGDYTMEVSNPAGTTTSEPIVVRIGVADFATPDWTTFGGSSSHLGHVPTRVGRHRMVQAWEFRADNNPDQNAIHPPVVAGDRVFFSYVSGSTGFPRHGNLRVLNLIDGSAVWARYFEYQPLAALSWHNDRLYFVSSGSGDPIAKLRCVSGSDGLDRFQTDFEYEIFTNFQAPVVTDEGIWIGAEGANPGEGALYAFELADGTERYRRSAPNSSGWSPTPITGSLLGWVYGGLWAYEPLTGDFQWNDVSESIYGSHMLPATERHAAVISRSQVLVVYDLETRSQLWNVDVKELVGGDPASFEATPAIAGKEVYVFTDESVRSFDLLTGTPRNTYPTGENPYLVALQPLILNDLVVASTPDGTWVYDRETAELLQYFEFGGVACYAHGHLLIADDKGTLRCYRANTAPEFTDGTPVTIDVADHAPPGRLDLGPLVSDRDPDETRIWAIVSATRPELFNTLDIDASTGDLTAVYNPWESGASGVTVSVTDSAGNVTQTTITFTVPPHPLPDPQLAENLVFNPQTGLYEHALTVTNTALREIAGFDLEITGLPAGVEVYNASACEDGTWCVEHRQPLAAGASVTLILEYYAPVRGTVIEPEVAVSLVTEPEGDPAAAEPGLAIDRCEMLADGLLIEFTATPGALYEIQYSNDNAAWKVSPTRIRAAGNRVQWIDRGPPRTDSPPADKSSRFYRVRELPENG